MEFQRYDNCGEESLEKEAYEMTEEIVRQDLFILTRDMVPISLSDFGLSGCSFVCPLPKGYRMVTAKQGRENIENISNTIKRDINRQAQERSTPFENILLGYHERTEEQQKELLKNFKIMRVSIDDRGVYGVWAGGSINSGDIYLNTDASMWYNIMTLKLLKDSFEHRTAFCCHNVDWYWQALLTREFCVRYFNWLNKEIYLLGKKGR